MRKIVFLAGLSVASFLFSVAIKKDVSAHRNSAMGLECASCHIEGPQAKLVIRGVPAQFQPGKTYEVTVEVISKLRSKSDSRGGFAVQASAGELKVKDTKRTQLINGYITHTIEGNSVRKWSFLWTAPKDVEEVTIMAMGVASDGDYSPYGDAVAVEAVTTVRAKPKKK